MHRIKGLWEAFKTFAILFSFIVNVVLVIVLVVLGTQLFQLKNYIAEPLIDGLHSSFVGLDNSPGQIADLNQRKCRQLVWG